MKNSAALAVAVSVRVLLFAEWAVKNGFVLLHISTYSVQLNLSGFMYFQ